MPDTEQKNGDSAEALYRRLPSVNDLLLSPEFQPLLRVYPREAVVQSVRHVLQSIRDEILNTVTTESSLAECISAVPEIVSRYLRTGTRFSLRPVINATGVILHTNLGRAPLSESAITHIAEVAKGYSNLELNLSSGERGSRDSHVEALILRLLATKSGEPENDTRAAIVVNNCAAATFIALNTLAEGKEVLISRGESVEIGGGFRIPEIMEKSGAKLREVGTTNRTSLADYERAISPQTGLILRVHQSNFSMQGFVTRPLISEVVALGRRMSIPVFEDQGTGLPFSLDSFGIQHEPTLIESYRQGCDLIAASGDKLLGGPQCGLLIGKRELVQRIRRNPLFRTYRVDKLTYAALEATLSDHLSLDPTTVPIIRMISLQPEEILRRCQQVVSQLRATEFSFSIEPVSSLIGGGTAPGATLRSYAVSISHPERSAAVVLSSLRELDPPVIGRISEDRVLLDLRTVPVESDAAFISLLKQALSSEVSQP